MVKNISETYLFINQINRNDIAPYECVSTHENNQAPIHFNISNSNLRSHNFPLDSNSHLHIEFLSPMSQMKLGGNILINCSSSDNTPVYWSLQREIDGIVINNSYLNILRFTNDHFDYYYCFNKNLQKLLVLSPSLFDIIKNFNSQQTHSLKHAKSAIEIIQGKYIGDNITLICRIGQGNHRVVFL